MGMTGQKLRQSRSGSVDETRVDYRLSRKRYGSGPKKREDGKVIMKTKSRTIDDDEREGCKV